MSPTIGANALVRVASTGNDQAERCDRIAIHPAVSAARTVVMSLGAGADADTSLPDLQPGDRLLTFVELEVTTNYTQSEWSQNHGQGAVGPAYDYAPHLQATVLLGADDKATVAAPGKSWQASEVRLDITHAQHHAVAVVNGAGLTVPAGWHGAGALNVVASATNVKAKPGDCLIIGQNQPDGPPAGDMGMISVVRLRGRPFTKPMTSKTLRLRTVAVHSSKAKPQVVCSLPLSGLKKNQQFSVAAQLSASADRLGMAGRLSTRLFLADRPDQADPDAGFAADHSANKGHITKLNGFNHLPGKPSANQKVGVLRITKDIPDDKIVYLNLSAVGGNPTKQAGPNAVLDLTAVAVNLTGYDPASFG
jgi:hypothetical protein